MRKSLLTILALVGFLHSPARAAKMVDCVLDQSQVTPTVNAFRAANFALHVGGLTDANGLPNALTLSGYEYFKPTDYARTKWMLDLYGETVTVFPGTPYTDLSKPANRSALRRAITKRVAAIQARGFMVDCIMMTAPGQGQYAADFIHECVGLDFIVNTGDPYTASDVGATSPWGRINRDAPKEWMQVGVNLSDGRNTLSQYARACSVASARIAAGKMIIIGVFDLNGAHASTADAFFKTAIFSNPLVYGHYHTSYDTRANVGTQLPGGMPVH
jgi:hypothetical protein